MGCGVSTGREALPPENEAALEAKRQQLALEKKQLEAARAELEQERKRAEAERQKLEVERKLKEEEQERVKAAAAAKRKAEEEAEAKRKAAEEAERKAAEVEAKRKEAEAAVARKKAAEEEAARRKAEEAEAERQRKEEEERRVLAEEAAKALDVDAELVMSFPPANRPLGELQEFVLELSDQLPLAIRAAPMRLLHIDALLRGWKTGIKVFEEVEEADAITVPYTEVSEAHWAQTAVLSWRWGRPKPYPYRPGFSPMTDVQFTELRLLLHRLKAAGFSLVWIDWSCVPQYKSSPMTEVMRSKLFYARARSMIVLPSYVAFEELPENSAAVVRVLLAKAVRTLRRRAGEGQPHCAQATAALSTILEREVVAGRDYFSRAWTLAERMARHGRGEPLRLWLSCETWAGMLVDALLRSIEDRTASSIYKKILGPEAAALLDSAIEPLVEAVATGSPQDEELVDTVASLFQAAVGVWRTSPNLGEAPSKSWLAAYLEEIHTGIYQAWSRPDLLWAVYSYFCFKPLDQTREDGVMAALQALVKVAGGDDMRTSFLATKMGMGHMVTLRPLDRRLHAAVEAGRTSEVLELLAEGAFIEALDEKASTPLLMAVCAGHAEVVQALLDAGAAVQACLSEEERNTALHVAAARGDPAVVQALLAAGAHIGARDAAGCTPLSVAAREGHLQVVELLLAASGGKDVDAKDGAGNTPLHHSAIHEEVRAALQAAGANVAARNLAGQTAEDTRRALETRKAAAMPARPPQSDAECALLAECSKPPQHRRAVAAAVKRMLVNDMSVNANAQDEEGHCAVHLAAGNGHVEALAALLLVGALKDVRSKAGHTPLHRAALHGHADALTVLLDKGVAPDLPDESGDTPLLVAARAGQLDCIRLLLKQAGVAKDTLNKAGNNALHCAALSGNADAVRIVLSAAVPNVPNKESYLPLHVAAMHSTGEVVRALLDAEAGIEALDSTKSTPLHCAAYEGKADNVRALLAAGANKEALNEDTVTPLFGAVHYGHVEVIKLMAEAGCNLAACDQNFGISLLHHAATEGKVEALNALIKLGANLTAQDRDGDTPLHAAAAAGELGALKALLAAAPAGAKEVKNKLGLTPLHSTAQDSGAREVVQALLDAGVNKDATTTEGDTALHLAAKAKHLEAVRALLAAGAAKVHSKGGHTAVHRAVEGEAQGTDQVLELLAKAGFNLEASVGGVTALTHAARLGATEGVRKLLALGANRAAAISDTKNTSLHLAAALGHTAIVRLLLDKAPAAVREARNVSGHTPLLMAAEKGSDEVLKLLLAAGADKTAMTTNPDSWQALELAAKNGHTGACKVLVEAGIDVNQPNPKTGCTPLHRAAEFNKADVIDMLFTLRSFRSKRDFRGYAALHVAAEKGSLEATKALLKEMGDQFRNDPTDKEKRSAFIVAAIYGHVDIMAALLENQGNYHRIEPDDTDVYGYSACMYSARHGHVEVLKFLFEKTYRMNSSLALVRPDRATQEATMHLAIGKTPGHTAVLAYLLKSLAANVGIKDKTGNKPIHYVGKRGLPEMVDLLVDAGADINSLNDNNRRPLDMAIEAGNTAVQKRMMELGARRS